MVQFRATRTPQLCAETEISLLVTIKSKKLPTQLSTPLTIMIRKISQQQGHILCPAERLKHFFMRR